MQLERLGVVGFFGVFVPGAYLATFVLLFLACLLELNGVPGHRLLLTAFREFAVLAASGLFLFACLLASSFACSRRIAWIG